MKSICIICNQSFESIKSTAKYCSQNCQNKARRIAYAKKPKNTDKKRIYVGEDKICPICGVNFRPEDSNANQRQCCYSCMPKGIQLTRGMFLTKIKEARGGRCIKCGYNKCIAALEFHHIDPSKKDFTISNDHFKLQEAVKESKKCIIICANCHREFHAGLWQLEDLEEQEEVDLDSYEKTGRRIENRSSQIQE